MAAHEAVIGAGEDLTDQELGEALPPSVRFKEKLDMARDALNVADTAKKLLNEEIRVANNELEAAGKLDSPLTVRTPEYFCRRAEDGVEKPFVHRGYGIAATPTFREISGIFEGLTVIDTQAVEYSPEKLTLMRGEQPERLVICGVFSNTEQAAGSTTYVPHEWLQGPEHAMMNIIGVVGRLATPTQAHTA